MQCPRSTASGAFAIFGSYNFCENGRSKPLPYGVSVLFAARTFAVGAIQESPENLGSYPSCPSCRCVKYLGRGRRPRRPVPKEN